MISTNTINAIETVSGRYVDITNIDPTEIVLDDIAWSISRISRFCGHTITQIPLNVGTHSVHVSDLIYEQTKDVKLALYGLFHDGAEAYFGDIPSPIKKIPEIAALINPIETMLLNIIFDKFIGSRPTDDEWKTIKWFDKHAQFIEAFTFMPSRGQNWRERDAHNITLLELHQYPQPQTSIDAYNTFIAKYYFLTNKQQTL